MLALEAIPLLKPIFILEDEDVMSRRLIEILRSIGYQASDIYLAESIQHFQKNLEITQPAIALIDLHLPDGNGLNSIEKLLSVNPDAPIVVISAWCDELTILEALKRGATGYLLKERDDLELLLAIRNVLQGGTPIDPFIAQYLIQQSKQPHSLSDNTFEPSKSFNLTDREKEVLSFIAHGLSNKEIADQLYVSKNTIETHIKNCYKKLFVSNRTMATQKAKSNGII